MRQTSYFRKKKDFQHSGTGTEKLSSWNLPDPVCLKDFVPRSASFRFILKLLFVCSEIFIKKLLLPFSAFKSFSKPIGTFIFDCFRISYYKFYFKKFFFCRQSSNCIYYVVSYFVIKYNKKVKDKVISCNGTNLLRNSKIEFKIIKNRC